MQNMMPTDDDGRGGTPAPVDFEAGTVYGHKVDPKMLNAVKALMEAGVNTKALFDWTHPEMKFQLGDVVGSAAAKLAVHPSAAGMALARHVSGDWGITHPKNKAENDLALVQGGRITSAFETESGVCFMISTNAERTQTHIVTLDELPAGIAKKIALP
jgi:hypothetical protein